MKHMTMTGEPQARTARLITLDGVRGIAAVTVLIHHSLLAVPGLSAPYYGGQPSGLTEWLLTYTPLHLLWAGQEAVVVFFVLSGLVLSLPSCTGRRLNWLSYYPQRLIRLYLPMLAALAFGVTANVLVYRNRAHGLSAWLLARPPSVSPSTALHAVPAILNNPVSFVGPLWSLHWEIVFSVLLPLYLWLGKKFPTPVTVGVLIGVSTFGFLARVDWAMYLPIFGAGVLVAMWLPVLQQSAGRLPEYLKVVLLVLSLVMCITHWLLGGSAGVVGNLLLNGGATLLVALAATMPSAGRVLCHPVPQWLGKVSFSLYLVHEPIVVAVGYLVGPGHGLLVLPIAVPLAFAATYPFYRFIEAPSTSLSRLAGRTLVRAHRANVHGRPGVTASS